MADNAPTSRRKRSKAADAPKRRGGIARNGSGASNQMGKRVAKDLLPLFVQHYLGDCRRNATAAALAVGANERSAHQVGYKWLQQVRQNGMLAHAAQQIAMDVELDTRSILLEVVRIAKNDPRRFYRFDGTLKAPDEWDDDMAAAVSSIEVAEEFVDIVDGNGKSKTKTITTGRTKKIKFWSKIDALDKAMRHAGLFEKDNRQKQENLAIQINLVGGPQAANGHANGANGNGVTIEANLLGGKR